MVGVYPKIKTADSTLTGNGAIVTQVVTRLFSDISGRGLGSRNIVLNEKVGRRDSFYT